MSWRKSCHFHTRSIIFYSVKNAKFLDSGYRLVFNKEFKVSSLWSPVRAEKRTGSFWTLSTVSSSVKNIKFLDSADLLVFDKYKIVSGPFPPSSAEKANIFRVLPTVFCSVKSQRFLDSAHSLICSEMCEVSVFWRPFPVQYRRRCSWVLYAFLCSV